MESQAQIRADNWSKN